MSLSRDGKTIAFREVGARDMGDLVVMDVASKKTRRLTNVNPELEQLALGELKPISWMSFDGMEIWGLLLTPPGYDPPSPEASAGQAARSKIPLLVYCHGGPIGGVTLGIFPQFMHVPGQIDPYPTEAFASAGFAVLFPMPRGGSGYGEAGHKMIINDWGGPDYKDIMAGVDQLIARGIADENRLGVMGASYGGYMTNWIVTQTSRFKAATAGASIADLSDLYYLTDGGDLMAEYYKLPWQNPEGLCAQLTADARGEGDDADPDLARRSRSARAARHGAEVLQGAAGARQDRGDGHLSARRPCLLRAAAGEGRDDAQLRVDACAGSNLMQTSIAAAIGSRVGVCLV